ncbi:MAG TPA: hypothetical protein VMU67_16440 [Steroidobacteraceae bacterium]|nr:hypothetical protein [Steroidobacteraceae bacterium]
MNDETPLRTANGEQARAEAQTVREHLRAAGATGAARIRGNASAAAEGAGRWARARFKDLRGQVEQRPRSAAIVALGIGFVAGFLVKGLFPNRD